MKKYYLFFLLLACGKLFAEEISPMIWDRKPGSINLTVSGALGATETTPNGATYDQVENYLWGSSTGYYTDLLKIAGDFSLYFDVSMDYYLKKWLGLHFSLLYELRKYELTWSNDSFNDATLMFDAYYLTLSAGPRLFFLSFFVGAEAYLSVPVSSSEATLTATHPPDPAHNETVSYDIKPDYGFKLSLGWRWRWSDNLFCEISGVCMLGLSKIADFNSFTMLSDIRKNNSMFLSVGLSYALK